MKISVKFFTSLRELVGRKEDTLNFTQPTVTIENVLKTLTEKYGKAFNNYVFNSTGQVKGHLQLLVNGQSVPVNNLATVLHAGDVLAILPPVGGG